MISITFYGAKIGLFLNPLYGIDDINTVDKTAILYQKKSKDRDDDCKIISFFLPFFLEFFFVYPALVPM